jgi:hypothetical protein
MQARSRPSPGCTFGHSAAKSCLQAPVSAAGGGGGGGAGAGGVSAHADSANIPIRQAAQSGARLVILIGFKKIPPGCNGAEFAPA